MGGIGISYNLEVVTNRLKDRVYTGCYIGVTMIINVQKGVYNIIRSH